MAELLPVRLDDKYTLFQGRIFLTGVQALVRLPMMQHLRDQLAGHRTGCYISGYRGSPLGSFDQQLVQARPFLARHDIVFQPGVNEDLAATALWGTQQAHLNGEGTHDGVFGIWYGKGPGVDRSGDAFRHANLAGTAPLGGVLVLMGDDHTCESSTTAHQSEYALVDAMIPVLNPAGVQEILDYGLIGWGMSRYSGAWVGLKCVKDTVEATSTVDAALDRVALRAPEDYALPGGGLNIRWPDTALEQEARLHRHKLDAVKAYARANGIDRIVMDAPGARIGIITAGKSYLDVRQAMMDLSIDRDRAAALGLRLYKPGMTFPLEPEGALRFARDLDLVIVVEEKRSLIEWQLKELLYGLPGMPKVIGKRDENGDWLFPSNGALEPNQIAIAIGRRLLADRQDEVVAAGLAQAEAIAARPAEAPAMVRTPYFCSGCPHNTSTRVPEGSVALAGIGCHYLAQFMDRSNARYTQMGAEGAAWIGEGRFSRRNHVFQNIGDGTYFHSGLLAVRAAIASNVNITYKILYNDAVAMTGGQPMDGQLRVPDIAKQMLAEGARRVVVVSDQPEKFGLGALPAEVTSHHRDDLDAVQRELREISGTTVLIYDQTCATEKRRRRKRNAYPDPPKRAFINEAVCEGCGDCGVKSNCVSIVPVETEFGRKRAIDQSACNKDYSCVKGFCPSFVTVHGGGLRRPRAGARPMDLPFVPLPEPAQPALDRPYGIIVTGVGGTGVVTIGAIVGMAAHLEGKGYGGLDMIGMAQKGGAVMSHLQVAAHQDDIQTARVGAGHARLVLGCDVVTTASRPTQSVVQPGVTRLVVNTQQTMTGDFTRNPDTVFPLASLEHGIERTAGSGQVEFVDASRIATALLGDSIATNMFMLGYAWQKGLVPLSAQSIERAIELNGAAVKMNQSAFLWGRRTAVDPAAVERLARPADEPPVTGAPARTLDETIAHRTSWLTGYQDAAYAARYRALVDRVRAREQEIRPGGTGLSEAVARYAFKLMAYKDEYEVARLHTRPEFLAELGRRFEGDYTLRFHLAPPLFARRDPVTGELRKREYGAWMLTAFRVLARFKGLRGTALDIFGYTTERRTERQLVIDYIALIERILGALQPHNLDAAIALASVPEGIRGFGHVKERHLEQARARQAELLTAFDAARPQRAAA